MVPCNSICLEVEKIFLMFEAFLGRIAPKLMRIGARAGAGNLLEELSTQGKPYVCR
jgi:hypothetical protein